MGLNDFARNTSVSLDSSRAELERLLRRAGAEKALSGWDCDTAFVMFVLDGVPIRQKIQMPTKNQYAKTEQGRDRKKDAVLKAWEQGCRQRMREFVHILKAKLISVSLGIRTVEHEFFADICLPSGKTVFEEQEVELSKALKENRLPKLLLGV